ncbi:MAG: hypothetical protein U9Q94_05530 [Candidatus Bipolaricaulota bacterium]|nr:hypothetical protein [Candidatus Bipolaricaulota bacterium]
MTRHLLGLVLLVLLIAVSAVGVPIDPGMGSAYSTVGSGPLSPLWNAAGALDSPGVHAAFVVTLSSSEEPLLLVGASIAAKNSPTVAWSIYKQGSDQETWGTFAFPIFAGTTAGLGVFYASGTQSGISFHAGVLYNGAQWTFGGSVMHIASSLFGGDLPIILRAGAALYGIPNATLAANISLSDDAILLSIGGEAMIWLIDVRWGLSIIPTGGIDRLGMGVGFDLFSIPIDLAAGVSGSDLQPYASLGISANIPAWW